jgi:hypothetical protein
MNNALFSACVEYDKNRVHRLVRKFGADDFECLVEFGYYDLAVFVFVRNLQKNIITLKTLDKIDIINLLNNGLPMYLPWYEKLHEEYLQEIYDKINEWRDKVKLVDDNILRYIIRYLPHRDRKSQ